MKPIHDDVVKFLAEEFDGMGPEEILTFITAGHIQLINRSALKRYLEEYAEDLRRDAHQTCEPGSDDQKSLLDRSKHIIQLVRKL